MITELTYRLAIVGTSNRLYCAIYNMRCVPVASWAWSNDDGGAPRSGHRREGLCVLCLDELVILRRDLYPNSPPELLSDSKQKMKN